MNGKKEQFKLCFFDCRVIKVENNVTSDLGEVPALDKVPGCVSSCAAVNHGGDVVPGHSGSRVSVDEV